MRWISPLVILSFIAFSQGCAKPSPGDVVPGKTTEDELHKKLGTPLGSEPSPLRAQAHVDTYPGDLRYQIEDGRVVAQFRAPEREERSLQYWRHRWKGLDQVYEPVPGTRDPHGTSDFQLRAPSLKMSVIYDPMADRVKRVVSYGSR